MSPCERPADPPLSHPFLVVSTSEPIADSDGFQPTSGASPAYRRTGPSVHALIYYVLLVTRRRRPLFQDPAVATRLEELLRAEAERQGLGVECIDVNPATVTIHVEAPPTVSPHKMVRDLRRAVTAPLKEEFEGIASAGGVFVRDYMVTSMPVPDTDCEAFERHIPKRWVPKMEAAGLDGSESEPSAET